MERKDRKKCSIRGEIHKNGFPVSESLAKFLESSLELLRSYPSTAKVFLEDSVAPYLAGETMQNPDLAATMDALAEEHARTFNYQAGDVGYVPFAMGHYVQNTGDTTLRFLEMFKSDHFADISLSTYATGIFERTFTFK